MAYKDAKEEIQMMLDCGLVPSTSEGVEILVDNDGINPSAGTDMYMRCVSRALIQGSKNGMGMRHVYSKGNGEDFVDFDSATKRDLPALKNAYERNLAALRKKEKQVKYMAERIFEIENQEEIEEIAKLRAAIG